MRVTLTENRMEIPVGREQWNALAAANATRTIFQTYEWFDAWWSAFGANRKLFFLTVHDRGAVVGFAPLMLVRGPLGLRYLEFVGTNNADYQDIVLPSCRADAIPLVCRFLFENKAHWDMMVLRNLSAQSPTVNGFLTGFRALGLGTLAIERTDCPTLLLDGRREEVVTALRRYSIERKFRRLRRRGPLRYRLLDTPRDLERHLPRFFDQHMQRREAAGPPSQFGDARHRLWFTSMASAMQQAGWLHFTTLECGEAIVAYHFGFRYAGVLSWYKPSFDRGYASDSPGTVLIRHLIEDACATDLQEVDFSGGLEPFKLRFSNAMRENLNLRVFASPILFRAFTIGAWLRQMTRDTYHSLRKPAGAGGGFCR